MKKKYIKPLLKCCFLAQSDVLTASIDEFKSEKTFEVFW